MLSTLDPLALIDALFMRAARDCPDVLGKLDGALQFTITGQHPETVWANLGLRQAVDVPIDALVDVALPRPLFERLTASGSTADWLAAYRSGALRLTGQPARVQALVGILEGTPRS